MWGPAERVRGVLGAGQMWVFWVVSGLGRVGVGRYEGLSACV